MTELGKIVEKYILSTNNIRQISVDKYVIMPNHIHLILVVENNGTSKAPSPTVNNVVSHAISTLKRFINNEIGKNIWQRSFHDHIIRGEQDYLKIWNYIDGNPQKWGDDCFYTEE